METPFVRYTLLTLAGSAIWCFAFAGAGWAAGESWEDFHHAFRYLEYLVAAANRRGRGLARRLRAQRRRRVPPRNSWRLRKTREPDPPKLHSRA